MDKITADDSAFIDRETGTAIDTTKVNVDLRQERPEADAMRGAVSLPLVTIEQAADVFHVPEQQADVRLEMTKPGNDADEKLPDNIFDRIDVILKRLPCVGIRATQDQGDLSLRDVGTFLKSIGAPIGDTQEKALNALRAAQSKDGALRLDWQFTGKLTDLLPEAKGVSDTVELKIQSPTFKVSADEKGKSIVLSDVKGFGAADSNFPLLVLPVLESISATKKIDDHGRTICEVTFKLPKLQGVPESFKHSFPLEGQREIIFDAALKQIASGKGCGKLVELLPALLPGEAANAALPLLSDLKEGWCQNGRLTLKFGEKRQVGSLPLFAGPEVTLEAKKLPDGYVFDNVKGIQAKLPVQQDILDKLGIGAEVGIHRVAVGTPSANGDRLVRIDLEHASLKSVLFSVNKDGAPIIKDGRFGATVQVAVGDKTLECHLNLPATGNMKDGMRIYIGGNAEAKVELLKKLGLPAEFAEVGKGVKQLWMRNEHIGLELEQPTTVNMKGLNLRFDKNVVLTEKPVVKREMFNHSMETRSVDLHGIQITDFAFSGSRWKEYGSQMLNRVLSAQNDLPITIRNISFSTNSVSPRVGIGISATGALDSAHFVLESKDKPDFVSGHVRVKNPLRDLDGLQMFRNRDYFVDVQLDGNGDVTNPIDVGIQLLKPVTDSPLVDVANPLRMVPAYQLGKTVYNNRREIVDTVKEAGNTLERGANWLGGKAGEAWRFIR